MLALHILAGFSSLILCWLAMFTVKGSLRHRWAGRWYARSMTVVVITAAFLSVQNLLQGQTLIGLFLGYVAILTAKPLWVGWAAVQQKHTVTTTYRVMGLFLNFAMVISGIAIIAYGFSLSDTTTAGLTVFFGGLGLISLVDLISFFRNGERSRQWLRQHIVGMGTSAIAAHTAFLTFGAARLFADFLMDGWALLPWVTPAIIGGLAIRLKIRRLNQKGQLKTAKQTASTHPTNRWR